MIYQVEFRPDAYKAIGKLDTNISPRILHKIKWLENNFKDITPEPLTGELKGLYKLRVGHFRIIYSVKGHIIYIHMVGHRSDIYKR